MVPLRVDDGRCDFGGHASHALVRLTPLSPALASSSDKLDAAIAVAQRLAARSEDVSVVAGLGGGSRESSDWLVHSPRASTGRSVLARSRAHQ